MDSKLEPHRFKSGMYKSSKGDTPDNNQVSAIVKSWTVEFCEENNGE